LVRPIIVAVENGDNPEGVFGNIQIPDRLGTVTWDTLPLHGFHGLRDEVHTTHPVSFFFSPLEKTAVRTANVQKRAPLQSIFVEHAEDSLEHEAFVVVQGMTAFGSTPRLCASVFNFLFTIVPFDCKEGLTPWTRRPRLVSPRSLENHPGQGTNIQFVLANRALVYTLDQVNDLPYG
jgi:hypothetical protein